MSPAPVVALSPHCDDLAFSLGGALCDGRFGDLLPVAVFTVSRYTLGGDGDAGTVTPLRKEEDRRFFHGLPGVRHLVWLDRLDAPLRLGTGAGEVRTLPDGPEHEAEAEALVATLLPLIPPGGRILAPLALGGHIDHRVVRLAALRIAAGREVLFYEDLPYAGESSPEAAEAAAAEALRPLGKAVPLHLPSEGVRTARERAVCCYRSQADGGTLEQLLVHPLRLARGGVPVERLWTLS